MMVIFVIFSSTILERHQYCVTVVCEILYEGSFILIYEQRYRKCIRWESEIKRSKFPLLVIFESHSALGVRAKHAHAWRSCKSLHSQDPASKWRLGHIRRKSRSLLSGRRDKNSRALLCCRACAKCLVTTVVSWLVFLAVSCVKTHGSDHKEIQLMSRAHVQIRSERAVGIGWNSASITKIRTEAENIVKITFLEFLLLKCKTGTPSIHPSTNKITQQRNPETPTRANQAKVVATERANLVKPGNKRDHFSVAQWNQLLQSTSHMCRPSRPSWFYTGPTQTSKRASGTRSDTPPKPLIQPGR